MVLQDIELIKFRLRRKLDKRTKREDRKQYINWEHLENLINDKIYQRAKKIQKEIEALIK